MGGKAFGSGDNPLFTPRMPESIYLEVQRRYAKFLRTYFTHVATPVEAPDKKDHGDVDFLVAGQTAAFQEGRDNTDVISKALDAERREKESYAVPWPKDCEGTDSSSQLDEIEQEIKRFIQIDVNVCQNRAAWEWVGFLHSHGDLWNIIGSMTRKLGLTANHKGLHLRIEEMEPIDRKKSMVFLSQKPSDVLRFLGLNEERFAKRFDSVQELFEYAASCRFFHPDDVVKNTEADKRELRHNDRKRMKMRPQFAMWVEQFIPACREAGTYNREPWTRDQVCEDVLKHFGVKDEFEQKLKGFQKEQQKQEIWQVAIKKGVPAVDVDAGLRAATLRALKAIILNGDISLGIIPAKELKKEDGFYRMEEVVRFIQEHWQEVGQVEYATQQVRATKRNRLKRSQGGKGR